MSWEWVAGTIIGILSLFGIGKLIEMAYKARLDRRKVQESLDQTNAGKEIDADVNAFEAINTRLAVVEARLDKVNENLTEQKVENAKLEGDNKRLTKDNERQEEEIQRQRIRLHDLAGEIHNKELLILEMKDALARANKVIETLRLELNATNLEVHELSRRLKGMSANE